MQPPEQLERRPETGSDATLPGADDRVPPGAGFDYVDGEPERWTRPELIAPEAPIVEPKGGADTSQLISASTLTLASSATGLLVALLRSKLVAVLLGPTGVGALSNLGIYNTFVATAGSAFAGQGATRAIATARVKGESSDRLDWLIRYTFLVPPAAGLLIMVATIVAAPMIAGLIMGSPEYAPLVVISAVAIPLGLLASSYSLILQGFVRIGSLARVNIATTLVSLVVTVALVFGFGLTGAVVATSLVALFQLGIFFLREPWVIRGRRWRQRLGLDREALKPVLALGFASVVLGIATTLVNLLIRTQMVATLGLEQTGVYQPVAAISDTYLEVLISSTSFYLFPRLTELLAAGHRHTAAGELGHGLRLLLAVTVPFLILAMAFGEPLVTLMYSGRFRGAADPLAIQMAGNVLKVITWSIGAAMLPLGFYRAWLAIGLVNLAVRYGGVSLLMPHLGLDGVAFAYSVSWAWSFAAEAFVVVFLGRLGPGRRDWSRAWTAIAIVWSVFGVRALSGTAGMVAGIVGIIVWLVLVRSELTDLSQSVGAMLLRRLAPLRAWGRGRR